jgi:hypothetical protein
MGYLRNCTLRRIYCCVKPRTLISDDSNLFSFIFFNCLIFYFLFFDLYLIQGVTKWALYHQIVFLISLGIITKHCGKAELRERRWITRYFYERIDSLCNNNFFLGVMSIIPYF